MKNLDLRTVSNRIAFHCWKSLHAAGVSAEEFVRHTGITLDALEVAGGRIHAERHARLLEYMPRFAQSRAIVDAGATQWLNEYTSLIGVCYNSATLRQALQHFLALRGLVGEFDFVLLRENGQQVEFDYVAEFNTAHSGMQAFANFKTLAFFTRAYDTGAATVFHVELQGKAPPFAGAISEFFGAPVRFGQARNLMRFDAPALDQPFGQYNALLAPHMLTRACSELQAIRGAHLFSSRVEQVIGDLLAPPHEDPGSDSLLLRLCEQLATTPWSLRRRLQSENTSFNALQMKVKGEHARQLLQGGTLSVADISERLGFASQSAFTRFFKLHHKIPPARYRQEGGSANRAAPRHGRD
ncbi:MAG: AraC family transcriptional regulator ligand-binding domain-containing protein [Pseudomonadota bacterium]